MADTAADTTSAPTEVTAKETEVKANGAAHSEETPEEAVLEDGDEEAEVEGEGDEEGEEGAEEGEKEEVQPVKRPAEAEPSSPQLQIHTSLLQFGSNRLSWEALNMLVLLGVAVVLLEIPLLAAHVGPRPAAPRGRTLRQLARRQRLGIDGAPCLPLAYSLYKHCESVERDPALLTTRALELREGRVHLTQPLRIQHSESTLEQGCDVTVLYLQGCDVTVFSYLHGCDVTASYLQGCDVTVFLYLQGCDVTVSYLQGCDVTVLYLQGCDVTVLSAGLVLQGRAVMSLSRICRAGVSVQGRAVMSLRQLARRQRLGIDGAPCLPL
ncbi:UNVERIFIED_CONTAM: hypothetical protein FKN15_032924 [Acipenser sinensis]